MILDLAAVHRAVFGPAVATVARSIGDLSLAEESVQEAFSRALLHWPERGTPDNPAAWITTAARNHALDVLRREALRGGKEAEALRLQDLRKESLVLSPVADDQLRTIFTCCHPALSPESQVALTLRLVCGLTTAEIARAFLQPEQTVAQRISRAKAKIRQAAIPLRLPSAQVMPERVSVVLSCVYLVFSEGYFATAGDAAIRDPLCDEAIRLGGLLCSLLPDDGEVWALQALMLLHDSRRSGRRTPDGALVPLEDQDRSAWDCSKIAAGLRCLTRAGERGGGAHLTQARIAAAHATAPTWESTDWTGIVAEYDVLARGTDSPAAAVARAVAVGFRGGWSAGLDALDDLADHPRLVGSGTVAAARADLLRRAGRREEAAGEYRRALRSPAPLPVHTYLRGRLADLEEPSGAEPEPTEGSDPGQPL